MEGPPQIKDFPVITVAMPTYNSARTLQVCLDAISEFDYPREIVRIVFVDNNSTDDTQRILKDFRRRFKNDYENIIVISEKSNIPEARNLCIEKSAGEYILFIDSDVVPPPETIERMLKTFASYSKVCIVGFPYRSDRMTLAEKMYFSKQKKAPHFVTSVKMGCTMIKRKLFNEIGFFEPEFYVDEDAELTIRARQAGYAAILDSTVTSRHLLDEKRHGTLREVMGYCAWSYGPSAKYHSMILRRYKPEWMVNRIIFYLAMAVSIPVAVAGVILSNPFLVLPTVACYSLAFAYHFPKASGRWRIFNSILYPLFGMSLAIGIVKETLKQSRLSQLLS